MWDADFLVYCQPAGETELANSLLIIVADLNRESRWNPGVLVADDTEIITLVAHEVERDFFRQTLSDFRKHRGGGCLGDAESEQDSLHGLHRTCDISNTKSTTSVYGNQFAVSKS